MEMHDAFAGKLQLSIRGAGQATPSWRSQGEPLLKVEPMGTDFAPHRLLQQTLAAVATEKSIWLWWSKPMGSHFGGFRCTTHFRTYFSGDWDVHWGYRLLTEGHMAAAQIRPGWERSRPPIQTMQLVQTDPDIRVTERSIASNMPGTLDPTSQRTWFHSWSRNQRPKVQTAVLAHAASPLSAVRSPC